MTTIQDILHQIDLEEIEDKQEEYLTEKNGYDMMKIPLKWIPELTYEAYRDSVNWKNLQESTKNIRKRGGKNTTDIELADGLMDMMHNSTIDLEYGAGIDRGKWTIVRDNASQIYWKQESDVVTENWVNYVIND